MKVKYFFLYLCLPMLFIILAFELINSFIASDYFTVEWLGIDGKDSLVREDISNKLESLKGKNIFKIDSLKIENEIKKDIRIDSIKIKKEYPDIVNIEIQEREAYIYVNIKDRIYLADKNGKIYAYRNECEYKDMLLVDLREEESLNEIYQIIDSMGNDFLSRVSEIFLFENDMESYYKIILKSGIYVKTNVDVRREKYDIGYMAYLKLMDLGDIKEYIDLRFNDDIYTVK